MVALQVMTFPSYFALLTSKVSISSISTTLEIALLVVSTQNGHVIVIVHLSILLVSWNDKLEWYKYDVHDMSIMFLVKIFDGYINLTSRNEPVACDVVYADVPTIDKES